MEVNTSTPGQLEMWCSGRKDPVTVPLAPGSAEQTAAWADELLGLIETHTRRKDGTAR